MKWVWLMSGTDIGTLKFCTWFIFKKLYHPKRSEDVTKGLRVS
jgi:hypothetical protein